MIVELAHEEAHLSRYKVQHLFNSSQNISYQCPYCIDPRKVGLILKENLIIGNTEQLDYKDVYLKQKFEFNSLKLPTRQSAGAKIQIDDSEMVSGQFISQFN